MNIADLTAIAGDALWQDEAVFKPEVKPLILKDNAVRLLKLA